MLYEWKSYKKGIDYIKNSEWTCFLYTEFGTFQKSSVSSVSSGKHSVPNKRGRKEELQNLPVLEAFPSVMNQKG